MNCTVCGAAEEHFSGEECVETLKSKLEATEKERLDLLARVGYAEGAGEEGLRRWELAEERARAAESRLEAVRKIAFEDAPLGGMPETLYKVRKALIAQLAEHDASNVGAAGSSPAERSNVLERLEKNS